MARKAQKRQERLNKWQNGFAGGTLAGGATVVSSSTSSDGKAVEFNAPVSSGSDYLTASGTNLMLNGKVFKFIGFDAYGMEGCWNGVSGGSTADAWTDAQLDTYFSNLPANGMTRLWAEQYYGTAVISNIVAQASKYNQHLVLSIGNDDGNCNPTTDDPNQSAEPLSFYQGGYESQYVQWVDTIVPMFADNPTVAMWEIANEPGNSVSVPEATMESYLNGAAAAIKAVDPNQLIESGFNYDGNANDQSAGNEAAYQEVQSGPNINVLSFHDYSYDYESQALLSGNYTTAQEAAKALDKPFITGEAGVEGGPGCTMSQSQRATWLEDKTNDYLQGIGPNGSGTPDDSGIMFWNYQPVSTGNCYSDDYDIFPGDPTITMVKGYVVP
jgi:hypothetical protein